jgi:hypothetical protein
MSFIIGVTLAILFLDWPWRALVIAGLAAIEALEILLWLKLRKQRSMDRRFYARLRDAGVSNFFVSRADYGLYRGATNLTDYLNTAERSVLVIAYWMAHGNEMENVAKSIRTMIENRPGMTVGIAVVDPDSDGLLGLADHLDLDVGDVRSRLKSTLRNLSQARELLPISQRVRLSLKVYHSTPIASVIVLDGDGPSGRIQLDFKPYRAPRTNSFGFELEGPGNPLFDTCLQSWRLMFDEAKDYKPPDGTSDTGKTDVSA